jgi:hypothetical protein
MQQEEVDGIDVIVSRLLEVNTIVLHLKAHLLLDKLGPLPLPRGCFRPIGEKTSE